MSGICGMNSYTSYFASGYSANSVENHIEQEQRNKQLRDLVRLAGQTSDFKDSSGRKVFAGFSDDRVNGFLDLSKASESKAEEKYTKPLKYNYKDVQSKILRAKTSLSAGRALLSAKRKVVEIKRKISVGGGDAEELQLALTHAKRMEMAARKKKHHLELEEIAEITGKRDEREDKAEETGEDIKNAMITAKEEEIAKQEDAIFDERMEMLEEAKEEFSEKSEQLSEEMLDELNEMISKFGEEELKELEEAMEMLESMEVIDPHMSKEDLEKLKKKHRASENKAIVKADMDYLKGMIKLQTQGSVPVDTSGMSGTVSGSSSIDVSI